MILVKWDAISGVDGYRIRWRQEDEDYLPTNYRDITGTEFEFMVVQPQAGVYFVKVCGLFAGTEGLYCPEIAYIPPPANVRWA